MTDKPVPRDPHSDNDLIDSMESEPGAQSGGTANRVAREVASQDELESASGGEPHPGRVTKSQTVQPQMPKRSDHEGAQTVGSDFD